MPPRDNLAVSIVFGLLLIAGGSGLIVWHYRDRNRKLASPLVSQNESRYLRRQFFRRLQVAILMIIMGIVIPAGDAWLSERKSQRGFVIYVLLILGLSLWMFLLASYDWLVNIAFNRQVRKSLRHLERNRAQLEDELSQMQHDSIDPIE